MEKDASLTPAAMLMIRYFVHFGASPGHPEPNGTPTGGHVAACSLTKGAFLSLTIVLCPGVFKCDYLAALPFLRRASWQ